MTITRQDVLNIAGNNKIVEYKLFDGLRPVNKPKNDNNFYRAVKRELLRAGYECHERRYKSSWGCGYKNPDTHFHKPADRNLSFDEMRKKLKAIHKVL